MQTRFPAIVVGFKVVDPKQNNKVIHTGKYHADNDQERRAFGERSTQAIIDGLEVRTYLLHDRRQFAVLGQLKQQMNQAPATRPTIKPLPQKKAARA